MAEVLNLLSLRRWRCYHTFDSRRSAPGFPDIIAVRGRRMLAIEVKTEAGKVTDEQLEWLRAFAEVPGVDAFILRPGNDWRQLEATLDAWEAVA